MWQTTEERTAVTCPDGTYLIGGRRYRPDDPGFDEVIDEAHARRQRPRCLCQPQGLEMYIARLDGGYIVKRMPGTGSHHTPTCKSYEPLAECSGLSQLIGSAITEDSGTGETTLRLGFPLAKLSARTVTPFVGSSSESVASTGTKLSLRGLLHYLWDQAELTRWEPAASSRRKWPAVRRQLLQAATHKIVRGDALPTHLYVPEPFFVEHREAITARRLAQWSRAMAAPPAFQPLMLLIGEVKEIVPTHRGFKVMVKHMPDQAFAIDERLYRRLGRRFEAELMLWSANDDVHMVTIATFGVSNAGIPTIHELSLMPTSRGWLPIEDGFDKQLVDRLVAANRSFVKGLRYNLCRHDRMASAVLIDCEGPARMLFIAGQDTPSGRHELLPNPDAPAWIWRPLLEGMPALPPSHGRACVARKSIADRSLT